MTLPKVKKMSTKSQISPELSESISNTLGKNVRILFKSLIRMESRGEKVDNRVLVVTSYRVFITTSKVPTRVDNGFHMMEIEALESKKPNHLSITLIHEHKPVSILVGEDGASEGVMNVVNALVAAFDDLFPNVLMEDIVSKVNLPFQLESVCGTRKHSTCGDFSNQYAAMCDLCQTPFRAEVAWDVDTIYLAHDIRMLHLKDFDHLEQRDLIPLLLAVQHNTWFSGVSGSGVRGTAELWEAAVRVLRAAAPPHTRFSWSGGSLRAEHASRLGHALSRAKKPVALHTVDLSHNQIEDRGAISVLSGLSSNQDGLRHISLSQCGISGKTVTQLAAILNDNPVHLTTLSQLDLSNNNLKDDVHNLYNFLAQPNVVTHLNLSNTETTLENLWGALLRGCAARLSELLISRNPWSAQRKSKEPPPSFRQFFTACLSLTKLDFAYCKMPPDALKSLLLGLACNESSMQVSLNLSGVLSSAAAHVLESCIHGVRCLHSLDLSDNNMEFEMANIVRAIGKNHSITNLSLSRLTGKRAYAPPLIQALVHVLQEPDTSITSLDLSDCRFKSDLYGLLNALGGARRLRILDITGNAAGEPGARLLAKALQCNCTLHTLYIDRNSFSLQGLQDIASGAARSASLRRVEFPGADAATLRTHADKLAAAWRTLHDTLASNAESPLLPASRLRALALERAWSGAWRGADVAAAAAAALPPPPLPQVKERAAVAAHRLLHQYLERCSEVFSAMGGSGGAAGAELVTLQAVRDAMAPCAAALQDLVTEAVESMALAACTANDRPQRDMPDLLPASHTAATPLGIRRREQPTSRRVRPKSVAEQQQQVGLEDAPMSLPPLQPPPVTPLRHLVKGRPKRTKTRAPTRPITEQQDNDEGLEEFWRVGRTPPDSEEPSLASRHNTLTSRSLQSVCSPRDDTMYSVTSGESTPILLEETEVSRCRSTDDVGTKPASTPPPSRSSDNVNSMEGVEGCVGGSIVGITPGAALTSSMLRDHPITPEDVAET